MLFLCGALVRGGLPERKKRQYPARDWDREPKAPSSSRTLEDDLTALLRYQPAGREEENDDL